MSALNYSFDKKRHEALAFDHQHIWHPYSSMAEQREQGVWPVESAQGVRIKLADGPALIDGMASWWSVIHGYSHPRLNQVLHEQSMKMSHVMFGGLTHEPAINLADQLVELTPAGLDKVFLADSGSVSVEVAIKMAIQYQHARGKAQKHKLLALKRGYHGDTLGAMSLCDPNTGMHHLFSGLLPEQHFVPEPLCHYGEEWSQQDILPLQQCLETHHDEIAALILEPVVQGAGGMRFYHPQYLREARRLCDEYDVLLIADEIATGFGRTGKMFACEHGDISPDILTLGKALTSGYMTLAATLTTDKVARTISDGEAGCFMHGPTFMANPLACSVANESLLMLKEMNWSDSIHRLQQGLRDGFDEARSLTAVQEVRVLGGIGVIEMKQPVDMKKIQAAFIKEGIWLRPFGKLVYVMPPYVMSAEDLERLTTGVLNVLKSGQF
jgi:adenosylmethionine-8-amino-7-oxononanoate aminotransferase